MSKPMLFVKGQREPIEIDQEEAEAAQKLLSSASAPLDTPFVIEGVWAGKKIDMRYVVFPKKEVSSAPARLVVAMDKAQAEAFEQEIEQDKRQARSVFGATRKLASFNDMEVDNGAVYWRDFFYQRRGAVRLVIRKDGRGRPFIEMFSRDPVLWGALDLEIDSYGEYLRKRDYVEGKKMAGLEDLAKGFEELQNNMTQHDETDF